MNSAMREWLDMARIDIKNQGEGNDVKISVVKGEHCHIRKAQWFSKGGDGYVLETYENHQVLKLECHGAGELLIRLQGVDRRSPSGTRLPLWVDYTRLAINGKVIFWEIKPQWHNRPYVFTGKVADGEQVIVEISWSSHGYKGEELAQLLSLWCEGNDLCSPVQKDYACSIVADSWAVLCPVFT